MQAHMNVQAQVPMPEVNDRCHFCQDPSILCFDTGTWDHPLGYAGWPVNSRGLFVLVSLVLREQAYVTVPSF